MTTVSPGDLVVMTWPLSCGTCTRGLCHGGFAAHCSSVPHMAMDGASTAATGTGSSPIWSVSRTPTPYSSRCPPASTSPLRSAPPTSCTSTPPRSTASSPRASAPAPPRPSNRSGTDSASPSRRRAASASSRSLSGPSRRRAPASQPATTSAPATAAVRLGLCTTWQTSSAPSRLTNHSMPTSGWRCSGSSPHARKADRRGRFLTITGAIPSHARSSSL
ncbi:hypothetical protein ACFTWS_30585 [Streptomyces sp. NPDC057027]|uniref:hypothetical protein n=1 Tax=Streptomyces sp. NPDC057027 TaxID=3346004 RepID=UPI003634A2ED